MQELEKILDDIEIISIKDLEEENERCSTGCKGCCSDVKGTECNCRDAIIVRAFKKLAKYINDGWIPVENRMPEKEYYTALCITDKNYYFVAVYNKEYGFRTEDSGVEGEIIAWRPLPEPYRPERSEE